MALDDYEIHLARETAEPPILQALAAAGLVLYTEVDERVSLPIGGHAFGTEFVGGSPRSAGWQVASLFLDDDFEELGTRSYPAFVEWIFASARVAGLASMLVPAPHSAGAGSTGPGALLDGLVAMSEGAPVKVAPPVLFRSARAWPLMSAGQVHEFYRFEYRRGLGSLFVFADVRADNSFEILDTRGFQTELLGQLSR